MKTIFFILGYIFLAPLVGGLLFGVDRKLSAWFQGRVGPPILQPFYDVFKLFAKESVVVRHSQNIYIFFYLLFMVFTGSLFFAGENILLIIFALTLADVFLVLGAYHASSPYSFIGAQRELLQIMSYEPALIFTAAGSYLVTGSFYVSDIVSFNAPLIMYLPAIFFALFYILEIKFRKSPFDLSTSHHAHQEIVKGITTEFSGCALAVIEIAHWYETVLVLGFVFIFFAFNIWIALLVTLGAFLVAVYIDNSFARTKWQITLFTSWLIAFFFGMGNVIVLYFLR